MPAVLAVHNGSALAASSNKMRCAVNAVESNQALPNSNVTGTDSWVRVQRYKDSNNTKFVKIADINAVASILGIGVAILGTSTQSIRWSDGAILSPSGLQSNGSNSVALRFDAGGPLTNPIRIVGIVTQAQSGTVVSGTSAIATTCWNSMMP